MDVVQAKTFLAIVEGGNFTAAANRLHITQSSVSARIQVLESLLGKQLFRRSKSGCELTNAGHQFHRFARTMVRAWEDARLQVAVPEGFAEVLVVGGQYNLWTRLLLRWVTEFRDQHPTVAVRGEIGMPDELMRELGEGILDLAVLYNPVHRPGTRVEELFDDRLIMVTTSSHLPIEENYVFIDWGEKFRAAHAVWYPQLQNRGLVLDIGALALSMILQQGGTAYLPERIVLPHLQNGQLTQVPDAPPFEYPVYMVYAQDTTDTGILSSALTCLRRIARGD